jgi:hypothetical protein
MRNPGATKLVEASDRRRGCMDLWWRYHAGDEKARASGTNVGIGDAG